jgi:hypothetical protein
VTYNDEEFVEYHVFTGLSADVFTYIGYDAFLAILSKYEKDQHVDMQFYDSCLTLRRVSLLMLGLLSFNLARTS